MNHQEYPAVPPTPQEYWDDRNWAHQHLAELAQAYPNQWIAVVDKQVVAVGKVIAEVRREGEQKTGRKHFPVIFAERGIHVYKNFSGISNSN